MRKKKSLKGLNGVYVVIEDLGPEMRGVLHRKQVRSVVEERLRMAGIPILREKEAAQLPNEPYLYVNLCALPLDTTRYACRIDIEFHQLVALLQDDSRGHAITWDEGVLTVGDVQTICDHIDDLVFDFIYDYLAMNPNNE